MMIYRFEDTGRLFSAYVVYRTGLSGEFPYQHVADPDNGGRVIRHKDGGEHELQPLVNVEALDHSDCSSSSPTCHAIEHVLYGVNSDRLDS